MKFKPEDFNRVLNPEYKKNKHAWRYAYMNTLRIDGQLHDLTHAIADAANKILKRKRRITSKSTQRR